MTAGCEGSDDFWPAATSSAVELQPMGCSTRPRACPRATTSAAARTRARRIERRAHPPRGASLHLDMRLRMWMTPPFWGGDVGAGAAPTCAGLDGTTLRHMRHSMSPLGFPTPWIGVYAMKGVAQLGRIEETHETNTQIDVRPGFAVPGRNPLHSVAPAWPAHQPLTPVTSHCTGRASLLSSSITPTTRLVGASGNGCRGTPR